MPKYNSPVNDTTLGWWLASMFAAFGQADPPAFVGDSLREDLGSNAVQYIMNGDRATVTPRRIFAKVGDQVLVVIQCTENNTSALALWNNWQTGEVMTGPGVVNGHLQNSARGIKEEMIRQGYYTPNILIAGHSQGGAIGHLLAVELLKNTDLNNVKCVSFGAPKAGGARQYLGLNERRICRWMTPDDPVPLLPPESAEAAIMGTLGNLQAARRMTSFVQPEGGRIIANNPPITTPRAIPSQAVLPAIGNFAGWLLGVESYSVPHRITTYSAYLAAFNARFPQPREQRPAGSPRQQPNPSNAREVTRQERVFVQNVFHAGAEQNRETLVQPRKQMFVALRQGRIWSVYLNNSVVAVGPRKKRARAIARLGNLFLTRLQKSSYVDQATLLAQVGSMLEQMADPAGSFRPPLRVTLPGQ